VTRTIQLSIDFVMPTAVKPTVPIVAL